MLPGKGKGEAGATPIQAKAVWKWRISRLGSGPEQSGLLIGRAGGGSKGQMEQEDLASALVDLRQSGGGACAG